MTIRAAVLVVAAFLVVGCGGNSVPNGPVKLAQMRADSRPYYWVGNSFEGLEVTSAQPYNGGFADVSYGTCEPPSGLFAEGGCAPPLSIQNVRCRSGGASVAIWGGGNGLAARAAKALQPLNAAAARAGKPRVTFDRSILC